MKKVVRKMLMIVTVLILVSAIYLIWDNQRVKVVEQTVEIQDLASELEGLTILQITDLHEKNFGQNQEKIIQSINRLEYDVIVFTGDMLNGEDSTNYKPFYNLIEGIDNKEFALYVPGNADPENYYIDSENNYVLNEFVQGMEERGVSLLESASYFEKDGARVRFDMFEMSILHPDQGVVVAEGRVLPQYAHTREYREHHSRLAEEIHTLDEENHDLLVALNHYPVVDERIEQLQSGRYVWRDFDLIMAGHYHGGQIRVPFIGALFVPEPWHSRGGLLPSSDRVSGLWEYEDTQQYVSRGLGASNFIPFLNFRVFNTPEINLITFKNLSSS
ncbi:metallophosphoesterase [Halobacillus sp. B23F22_1]|uniref:metallophosphoesterase n=1 Tax=Halobacillus sp. B23F22_1 TaxID=3459514 RepID=UPI00373F6F1F